MYMLMDKIYFFTHEQGNMLIRLLLAHILADFVLQTKKMVENKSWGSKYMLLHIAIVSITVLALSVSWKIALIITVSHWVIDSVKERLQKKNIINQHLLFVADQLLHLLVIVSVWCFTLGLLKPLYDAVLFPFTNYKTSLYLLSYAIAIWPLGYLIKFALHKMAPQTDTEKFEHGGKLIGQFERIIILTFVLLGQYEAIGFLITGKSIIRFAQKDENLKSEYVLLGTMMSYSLSILIGVIINWLLKSY